MADAAHMSKPLTLSSELVPVTYAEALLQLAGELGVGREQLLSAAGLRAEQLHSPIGRLSLTDFHQLASAALLRCDEPALGLLLGLRLNASAHGILGYALLSSANLGKAVHFALRYYRVLGLTFDLELVDNPDSLELRASESIPLGMLSRFAAEGLFGSLYAIAQFLLGELPQGVEIGFAYPEPAHARRYHEAFGVAAAFDQPWHWFRLPRHYLDRPMALANPATMQMCEQQCEALLASLDVQEGLLSRLRRQRPAHQRPQPAPPPGCCGHQLPAGARRGAQAPGPAVPGDHAPAVVRDRRAAGVQRSIQLPPRLP